MIRATFPSRVRRVWLCAWCDASGNADSERHQISLSQAHLKTCTARARQIAMVQRVTGVVDPEPDTRQLDMWADFDPPRPC
jgi:hypothetical protein